MAAAGLCSIKAFSDDEQGGRVGGCDGGGGLIRGRERGRVGEIKREFVYKPLEVHVFIVPGL